MIILIISVLALVAGTLILPATGAKDNSTGTSITVKNLASGAVPTSAWSYTIKELSPPPKTSAFLRSFTLPAGGGGSITFGGLRSGSYLITETAKFGSSASYTVTSNKNSGSGPTDGFEAVINLVSSESKTVTFTNTVMPAFAMGGLLVPPPSDLGLSIPPLKPIPVQVSLDVDINNDGRLDLVLGKPTVILVNLADLPTGTDITVSVVFEGNIYSRVVQQSTPSTVISFYSATNPIVPRIAGNKEITGIYQVNGGAAVSLTTTLVTVKDTVSLSLYYAPLTKSNYGSPATFSEMMVNSVDFINATYPIKNVTYTSGPSITGNRPGSSRDPYAGMLKDAQAVAQQAQLSMGGSAIGVAIAPAVTGLPDYFKYHGVPGAAGVSFGPAVKGVIALERYTSVPNHEVAHAFGLYYGIPEEYLLNPTVTASGVWASRGEWRTGYNFMSVAQLGTPSLTWVNTDTTYEYLFKKTRVIPNDPQILTVSGTVSINADGSMTASFPLDWVHVQQGIPDILEPGDYSLNLVDGNGDTLRSISFGLDFSVQIELPGDLTEGMGGSFVPRNEAGFSFAIEYPQPEITKIQVVNSITGEILATYNMADVRSFGVSASLAGTEGLNDWYVSPVDVTITSTADATATPPIVVSEIHYILDGGTPVVVSGSSASLPPISADGSHSLEYWGVDNLGNIGVHHIQPVNIDQTAPSTANDYDGAWHNSDFTITLTATDGAIGSGVSETYYRINGGATKNVSAAGQPKITTESATNRLEYWSVDVAGNAESLRTLSNIKLDKTAPIISGSRSPAANAFGWNNVDVTVHFDALDSLSGLESVTADTILTGEGAGQHVLGTATDRAGNSATFDVTDINIDKTKPTITGSRSPAANAFGWNNVDVTVSFAVFDGLSGINPATVPANVVLGEGVSQSVTGGVSDLAGNSASATVGDINIDKTAPTLIKGLSGTVGNNGWWKSDVTVTLTGGDTGGSGIASVEYNLNGDGWTAYTVPFTISAERTNTLEHKITDKAGNSYTLTSQTIKIDKTPPTITTIPDFNEYVLGQSVIPSWSATDSLSGVASVTGTIDTSTVGTKTLIVTAIDNAGNTATATRTYYVRYIFSGFQQPIPESQYNLGRTVPVKFQLKDSQGNFVTTANAQIYVAQKVNLVWGDDIPGISNDIATGNTFSYDSTTNQYKFNLKTNTLSIGELRIKAVLDDGTSWTTMISLT